MPEGRAPPVVAIDGPAASGKGTVALRVAKALGYRYLDSGALYRLVALSALDAGADPDDESAASRLAETLEVAFTDAGPLLEGRPVRERIREEDVSSAASRLARHPAVRRALIGRQRAFRRPPGLVAEGRDMGTVVFPDAAVKVFVTASAEERALRRQAQLAGMGIDVNIQSLLRDIRERDERDAARATAPLRAADDACILETTDMSIDAVVETVLARVRAAGLDGTAADAS